MKNGFQKLRGTILQITLLCICTIFCGFNSQEHKILADVGVSRVKIPASINFPNGLKIITDFNYKASWESAKLFAVGFSGNDASKYDEYKAVQDNCYWWEYGYGQSKYNKDNYVEGADTYPKSLLLIPAYAGKSVSSFSFGDLVAIYGDYRRTIYENDGDCYLTNDGTESIKFSGNNFTNSKVAKIFTNTNYCPPNRTTAEYLRDIAFGVVPPCGSLGNSVSNSTGNAEYDNAAWWGDEMDRLAKVNDNHFSNVAIAWYVGMHRLALFYVQKAIADPKYWKAALHYEAAALHCLTDLMAFGHVITNRDQSTTGAMKNKGFTNSTSYLWTENSVKMGGATRLDNGMVVLSDKLPPIATSENKQKDFLDIGIGTWAVWGAVEHAYHDDYNKTGATVRNFKGDKFQIYGDGKLHNLSTTDRRVIEDMVTASVQSLVDSYDLMKSGTSLEDRAKSGSNFFAALQYVPVFIESEPTGHFLGMWTLYAGTVRSIIGLGQIDKSWESCRIPPLDGSKKFNPPVLKMPCTTFPY